MYISYFDETGDDGYPQYSSDLFLLTSVYMHHQNWKDNYSEMYKVRKYLKDTYNLPVKLEIHTKHLLTRKKLYNNLQFTDDQIIGIIKDYAKGISNLSARSVNVCIDKNKINASNATSYTYILDSALKFNIQRIENDLKKTDSTTKFMIITDEGRVGKMTSTARKIQKINYIPSKYSYETYRDEIKLLIEDPLPKNSSQSHFVQIADFISFFMYLREKPVEQWHGRAKWFGIKNLEETIEIFKPILNDKASGKDKYGVVKYPK